MSISTVISTLNFDNRILIGLSLVSLILVGFNNIINPLDRSHNARSISIEFSEIFSNIEEFMFESKTDEERKIYANHINSIILIWRSQMPNIFDKHIRRAKLENAPIIRPSNNDSSNNGDKGRFSRSSNRRPTYQNNNFKPKD